MFWMFILMQTSQYLRKALSLPAKTSFTIEGLRSAPSGDPPCSLFWSAEYFQMTKQIYISYCPSNKR